MKKLNFLIAVLLCIASCSSAEVVNDNKGKIGGLTIANFPRLDGSTSTKPLNAIIACKLLDIRYEWRPPIVGEWVVVPSQEDIPAGYSDFFEERIKVSQTHGAFMNLIDNSVDIILTHRTISPDEQAHAAEVGVSLIETPIALDAFDFIVNRDNPVKSLSVSQIQDIYTGKITNWKQVGGNDATIEPYTRPRNSGSEEVMRSLVMEGLEIADLPEIAEIGTMAGVFPEVMQNINGITYTFNYYKETIFRWPDGNTPRIKINGIFPDENSIKDNTYPFVPHVHVAIRSDLDKNSMAYKLYEWFQTEAGRAVIAESGYIPETKSANSISKVNKQPVRIYPNATTDGFHIMGLSHPAQLTIVCASGKRVLSKQVAPDEYISISSLPQGIYIVLLDTDKGKIQSKIIKK